VCVCCRRMQPWSHEVCPSHNILVFGCNNNGMGLKCHVPAAASPNGYRPCCTPHKCQLAYWPGIFSVRSATAVPQHDPLLLILSSSAAKRYRESSSYGWSASTRCCVRRTWQRGTAVFNRVSSPAGRLSTKRGCAKLSGCRHLR
jgi:hypothetical protein